MLGITGMRWYFAVALECNSMAVDTLTWRALIISSLRRACFGSRATFESSAKAWCFVCETKVNRATFEIYGDYEGPRWSKKKRLLVGERLTRSLVRLPKSNGKTPLCPLCYAASIVCVEQLHELGLATDKKSIQQILKKLKSIYVHKTSQSFGPDSIIVLGD